MISAIVTAALLIAIDTGNGPTYAEGSRIDVKGALSTDKAEVAKATTTQVVLIGPVKTGEEKTVWTTDKKLGIGFASGGAVLALLGLEQFLSAERLARDARLQMTPQAATELRRVREQNIAGGVCVSAGVASLVGGIALFLWPHIGGSTTELTAALIPGGTGLSFSRHF